MDYRVSCIAAKEYDVELLRGVVARHFHALGVWEELRPGMRVTLKPNLLKKNTPDQAVTTHPTLVEAVAMVLRDHGVTHITLADSPGGPYNRALLQSVYAASGMEEAARRQGIHLNTGLGHRERTREENELCRSFSIIDAVADADYVINLPKLKTHAMTGLSGGVKNLFGCVPGLQKPELHYRFPEKDRFARMLVDLALLVRPGVTLMDAVVAMEGDGPSAGVARPAGWTLAAKNPHALDRGLCHLIGMPVEAAYTVAQGVAAGLCPADAGDLMWLEDGTPEPLPNFVPPRSAPIRFSGHVPRVLQGPLAWAEERFLSPRPAIVKSKCIGCRKCEESCAPKAVVVRQGKAVLNTRQCIRCYCCQEMCPVQAVHIRKTGLFRF